MDGGWGCPNVWWCPNGWGHGWECPNYPLPKVCHVYATMIKLDRGIPYLMKIQKYLNHVTQPMSSDDISMF